MKKVGLRIKEVPTVWRDVEDSKINLKKATIQVLLSVIQLRVTNSPFKRLLKPLRSFVGFIWRKVREI